MTKGAKWILGLGLSAIAVLILAVVVPYYFFNAQYWFERGEKLRKLCYIDHTSDKKRNLEKYNILSEAIKSYDKALQINPNLKDAYSGKGDALFYLGLVCETLGVKSYEELIDLDPKDAKSWYLKAEVLTREARETGNQECNKEAIKCYMKAMTIDPSYEERARRNINFTKEEINKNARESVDKAWRKFVVILLAGDEEEVKEASTIEGYESLMKHKSVNADNKSMFIRFGKVWEIHGMRWGNVSDTLALGHLGPEEKAASIKFVVIYGDWKFDGWRPGD